MQTVIVTDAECEMLFNNQVRQWQGQNIGRQGVLPVHQALPTGYTNPLEADNQPWWVARKHDHQQFSGLLYVDPGLSVFEGHFPGNPILPGVLQIDWAVAVSAEVFEPTPAGAFSGMSQIKFLQPVTPGSWLKLELSLRDGQVTFTYSSAANVCTKGKLHYRG